MSLLPNEWLDVVRAVLGDDCAGALLEAGDEATIVLSGKYIVELMMALRDDPRTRLNQLVDLCAVDDPAREKRFEVVYNLLSLPLNRRLRVCVAVGEGEKLPSVTSVYPSAGWFEREAFDLFGIIFDGHGDLRRILTDYGFQGHPLRRDFPLTGFTQKRYDDLQARVVDEPVALEQDYRAFDALSPWRGVTDVQKRGGA